MGVLTVNSTVVSTNSTTGSLVLKGGAGIAGNLNVQGTTGVSLPISCDWRSEPTRGNNCIGNTATVSSGSILTMSTTIKNPVSITLPPVYGIFLVDFSVTINTVSTSKYFSIGISTASTSFSLPTSKVTSYTGNVNITNFSAKTLSVVQSTGQDNNIYYGVCQSTVATNGETAVAGNCKINYTRIG